MNDYEKQFKQLMDGLPIDDRPGTEHKQTLRQQMLAEFEECSSQSSHPVQPIWSKIMKSNMTKSVAAAIIVVGTFIFLTNGASLALADVIKHFTNPYQCTQTVYYGDKKHQTITLYRLNLSQRREERPNNETFIVDMRQKPTCTLYLYNNDKVAQVKKDYEMGPRKDPDLLQMLTNMEDGDAEQLGLRKINGVQVEGFRTVSKYNDITIWADTETGLPVQVVIIHLQNDRKIVFEGFQFDVNFDPGLFSTDPPEGYQISEYILNQETDDSETDDSDLNSSEAPESPEAFIPYSCVQTVYRNEKKVSDGRVFYKTLSIRREEHADDGSIHIVDHTEKPAKVLRMEPDRKKATLTILYKIGGSKSPDMLAMLARMRDGESEKLGPRSIDGIEAKGFRTVDPYNNITIWADIQTGLPVKIEVVHVKAKQKIVMNQFDFETKLDDSLFLMTPPEGYELNEKHDGLDLKASVVTKDQLKQSDPGYPVYTLKEKLSWTLESAIIEGNVPGESDMRLHGIAATSKDGRHVSLAQCSVYNMLKEQIHAGHKCLELNGFTVWNGGPEKWYSKIALESAAGLIPPGISENRTGYAIETPAETVIIVGINGALTHEELLEMVEALALCTDLK